MIAFIRGVVCAQNTDHIVLENAGIGYQIFVARPFEYQLNETQIVHTYQHVREDALILFGFKTIAEKDVFTEIINVKGIGPKTAVNILSKTSGERFITAIEDEDLKYLTTLPGIGKKTASQILLDLKGKFVRPELQAQYQASHSTIDEALLALSELGFKQNELNGIKNDLIQIEDKSLDNLVKKGLQLLHNRKGGRA